MDSPDYIAAQTKKILSIREKYPFQPIIFAGSGLSRRWINSPTWVELLEWAISNCSEVDRPLQFYRQQEPDLPKIATRIAEIYQSWAWGAGRAQFPKILFESSLPRDIYLKHAISQHIKSFGSVVASGYAKEAEEFSTIRPHAVITTNYDQLVESVLPDYQPVLGEGLISAPFASIGEIYKIHGTVDKPSSLVLTHNDYEKFGIKRKYLTSKLLTFFVEHPVVFVGYSVEDENIRKILADLDEAVNITGGMIANIFFLTRRGSGEPSTEKILQVSASKGVRVNSIEADDFSWVFKAFAHNAPLSNVNPQVLRSLLARSYQLVRSDIPRQKMDVDFELISGKLTSGEEFAKVFGIATLQPATEFSARYRYNLTDIGVKLGYSSWHGAQALLNKVCQDKGVDIKKSDNDYHCTVKIGRKSSAQMYSDDAIDLLKKVRDGEEYSPNIEV
jgi:hypothetical protein